MTPWWLALAVVWQIATGFGLNFILLAAGAVLVWAILWGVAHMDAYISGGSTHGVERRHDARHRRN